MEERIKILLAEIEAQKNEIWKIYSSLEPKIEKLRSDIDNEDLTNSLAYKLHNRNPSAFVRKAEIVGIRKSLTEQRFGLPSAVSHQSLAFFIKLESK